MAGASNRSATGRRSNLSQADAWKAVVGTRNQAYYLRHFQQLTAAGSLRLGWHWPAFFATIYWLLYRKMWGWALLYFLALPALAVCDGLVASATGPFQITLDGVGLSMVAFYLVLPATIANWLYLKHCNRLVRRARRKLPQRESLGYLGARGGTSESAAMAAVVVSGLALIGVTAGLGLAVYDDYGKREKVVEALRIGAGARAAVAAFVNRQGTVPRSFEEAGFQRPALPDFVSDMQIDPRTGTIEIATQVSKAEMGAIYLVPQADDKKRVVWSCHADASIQPFTPRSCRDAD